MPERRKIVPGSKLHGQEDGKDRDSPTDIESKLGFKENLDKKKGTKFRDPEKNYQGSR